MANTVTRASQFPSLSFWLVTHLAPPANEVHFFILQVLVAASHCSLDLQSCGPLGVWAKVGSATAERNPPSTIAEINLLIASPPFSSLLLDGKIVCRKNVARSHRFRKMSWAPLSDVLALCNATPGSLECSDWNACTRPPMKRRLPSAGTAQALPPLLRYEEDFPENLADLRQAMRAEESEGSTDSAS